ncbi:MAG: LexA family transcriptional regulator [Syntrophaceae bacterium]|nr:LexA family transcriptional regulator [Syntrophaceae bacterium]
MTNFDINKIKRANLRRIMEKCDVTPTKLALLIGVKQPHISSCLNGSRNIGDKTINKICEALNIDKSEFFSIESMSVPVPVIVSKPIPVISWVHAGSFVDAVDSWPVGVSGIADPVQSYVKTGPNAFGLIIDGDSMLPRFMPGDIAIIDPAIRYDNGSVCVVWVNGEVSMKLFWDKENEIILRPMNDKYPDTTIKKDSKVDFRVIGKVVDVRAKL